MPCFHGHLPQEAAGVKPSRQEIYLTCSRTDAAHRRPASVRGDNNGCSKGLRSNSVTGSLAPRQNRSPCRPHPPYPFHPSGCAAQMETQWASEAAGFRTVATRTTTTRKGAGRRSASTSGAEHRDPLLTANQFQELPADQMLVFIRGRRPLKLRRIIAHTHKVYRDKLDPNPTVRS